MADRCPRCQKPVYHAEEHRALGKKWHKLCLKCAECKKMLDSTTCTEHEGEAFCKSCYGKLFGPKGYGFGGGAAGLSANSTAKYGQKESNVSHYAQAQAAPVMNGSGSSKFGGGEKCPSCNKSVYFAEEIRALGFKWHKICFKCDHCNKLLDSTTCTDHDGKAFCKVCYGKLHGPKGYGFAGGASGLSMDTGRAGEVATGNRSHLAEAQAAPLMNANPNLGSGGRDLCGRCCKQVYFAEQIMGGGNIYHKACFKCNTCSKTLDSTTLTQNEGNIFCKSCYGKNFGPKGFGYGQAMQHTT